MIVYYRKNFYTTALERLINEDAAIMGNEINFLNHLVSLEILKHERSPKEVYYISENRINDILNQIAIFIYSPKIYNLEDLS